MKKHNIYRDIIWLAVFCIVTSKGIGWAKEYAKEQKIYSFCIQADKDLTESIIEEFRKISGICSFVPSDTADVSITIENYTLQTEVMGFDFEEYPFKWEKVPDGLKSHSKISMGNMPVLFFGSETFSLFADQRGYPPLKSQIEKWTEQYQKLNVTVTDESGREQKARICGILSKPGDKVCMDKNQMREVFGSCLHTAGGFMEIYGYTNMKKARGLLENAGFVVLQQ